MQDLPKPRTALILLVEHDQPRRLRDANALLDEGYEVVESESILEAINFLERRDDFDAMVVDMSPPHTQAGLALVQYAVRRVGSVKVLVGSTDDIETDTLNPTGGAPANTYKDGDLLSRMRDLIAT